MRYIISRVVFCVDSKYGLCFFLARQLFNSEFIDCFVFPISYTVLEIIEKKLKTHQKMVLQKTLYLTEYHLFFSQLRVILFFFNAEEISKMFIVPPVTVRKIHGREVVSYYRIASLTAYKYLRRIIVLFLLSHCIKVYNICSIFTYMM